MTRTMKFIFFVFVLLILSCSKEPRIEMSAPSAKEGSIVVGFVKRNGGEIAQSEPIFLLNADTQKVVGTAVTDFLGKYEFSGLPPGAYILQVSGISRSIAIGEIGKRVDIDLDEMQALEQFPATDDERRDVNPVDAEIEAETAADHERQSDEHGLEKDSALPKWAVGVWCGITPDKRIKLSLCPDAMSGDFMVSTTSDDSTTSVSGATSGDEFGKRGVWSIQGDLVQGVITLDYEDRTKRDIKYRRSEFSDCLIFDDIELCRTAETCKEGS